jgi:hypothetical protein
MLKIKDGIDLKKLEEYGFNIGEKFIDNGERCICNESEYNDYWKFSMDEDEPEKVLYADDEFDQAIVSIHVQSSMGNRLYIECTPSCSYHIEGFELNIVTDTLYQMILDGIVEQVKQ